MSRRQKHKAARIAVQVRKVQDQAALAALLAQQHIVHSAQQAHDQAAQNEADAQDAWRTSLESAHLDLDMMAAWRNEARRTAERRSETDADLKTQVANAADRANAWKRQLRFTDAALSVLSGAGRNARRVEDEILMAAAEDIALFRRRLS